MEETTPEHDDATPATSSAPSAHSEHSESSEHSERTGNPLVDEVLDSLDRLDGRPVEEHVPVFEAAHEKLRRALSEAADAPDAGSEHTASRPDGA